MEYTRGHHTLRVSICQFQVWSKDALLLERFNHLAIPRLVGHVAIIFFEEWYQDVVFWVVVNCPYKMSARVA